jgi:hypothetical protein
MDGQRPRQHPQDTIIDEIVELRRRGIRFIMFADDNFYPVTLDDLAAGQLCPRATTSKCLERSARSDLN